MTKDSFMTLEKWYFDKNTTAKDLTDEQFICLLSCLDFELGCETLQNNVKIYYLIDTQKGNLANIEQDIFFANHQDYRNTQYSKVEKENQMWLDVKDQIIDRLEVYMYDYFERD